MSGNSLAIELKDGVSRRRPETEGSLTETSAHGVDTDKLKDVKITVKEDSGASLWLGAILPFLLPFFLSQVLFGS